MVCEIPHLILPDINVVQTSRIVRLSRRTKVCAVLLLPDLTYVLCNDIWGMACHIYIPNNGLSCCLQVVSTANNIISGTKFLSHHGKLSIIQVYDNRTAVINFKDISSFTFGNKARKLANESVSPCHKVYTFPSIWGCQNRPVSTPELWPFTPSHVIADQNRVIDSRGLLEVLLLSLLIGPETLVVPLWKFSISRQHKMLAVCDHWCLFLRLVASMVAYWLSTQCR